MIEIVILTVFFVGLTVGGLVANALSRLPNAEQLQAEDRERFARFERDL